MTSIFRRVGRPGWTLKYRDATGRERMRTFKTREAAKDEERRLHGDPAPGTRVTLREYAERWLRQVAPSLRPGSLVNYSRDLQNHILPMLGHRRLRDLSTGDVKDLLSGKRATLSKKTVANIGSTLHACLAEAVADGFLSINPATMRGRSRSLQLHPTRAERAAKIRAMDAEQLGRFLAACNTVAPEWLLFFRVMVVTGLRPGEALALRWEDFDLVARQVHIRRGWTQSRMQPTKSGHERRVDLSETLSAELASWQSRQAARALQRGKGQAQYVFQSRLGAPRSHHTAELTCKAVLKAAGLPLHFTPHSMRHTYASLQLSRGVSIYYVQRQLGHASIQMTVDHYGSWLPATNPGAADDLEEQIGGMSPGLSPIARRTERVETTKRRVRG